MNTTKDSAEKKVLLSTKELALIGLMSAVMCILGPIAVPIFALPVPVSLGNLAIFLSLYVLGMKRAFISYLIYLLVGLAGLPVFTGFAGGFGKAAGPTGGYLIGFFFIVWIGGYVIDRWPSNKVVTITGMVLSSVVCNMIGTLWLSHYLGITFAAGLITGTLPYLPGDIAKIIVAALIGPKLRRSVRNV